MKLIAIFLMVFAQELAHAEKVISIADGDTMTVLHDGKPLKIRLANIDAPEKKQAFGTKSKESLSELCWGKDSTYAVQNIDKYGRSVAVVTCGGVEVNRAQVERGMAWVYTRYNKDASLVSLETAAKSNHSGLWIDKAPVAPWDFRHGVVPSTNEDAKCYTGPRGGRYQLVNGVKRYGC